VLVVGTEKIGEKERPPVGTPPHECPTPTHVRPRVKLHVVLRRTTLPRVNDGWPVIRESRGRSWPDD